MPILREIADDLTVRRVEILVSQSRLGTLAALSLCGLFGFTLVERVGWPAYGAWYAVVACGYLLRQWYYHVHLSRQGPTPGTLDAMAAINTITGALAVSCLPLFSSALDIIDLALLSALVVGWAAVTVTVLSARPRIYGVFLVLSLGSVLYAWHGHVQPHALLTLAASLFFGGVLLLNVCRMMEHQQQSEYEHQKAITDSLTQLPNREGIRADGDAHLRQGNDPLVLVLDLDSFKAINDALGYEFGDAVLIEAARRLHSIPEVKVGRLHASQFCLLASSHADTSDLIEEVRTRFAEPLNVMGEPVDISFTVGVAVAPRHGQSMQHLIRAAAIATHAAQRVNADWLTFSDSMELNSRADLSLLSKLKDAVTQNQLEMHLQPKVRIADGSIESAEALIRWRHPERGLVPPSEFIPFAEQTGSIRMLTEWMLKKALLVCAQQRVAGRPIQISVNISASDLRDDRLGRQAQELAARLHADPRDIRFEVTESSVMDDPDTALKHLYALRQAGFSLSIDDFGTGYSSLAYLQKMPVQELKVDRSFVKGVQEGSAAEVLLDSICSLAHRMGLSIVAEGVETAEEWAIVKRLGCEYVQGWYVAKAMPVEAFWDWRQLNEPVIPPGL